MNLRFIFTVHMLLATPSAAVAGLCYGGPDGQQAQTESLDCLAQRQFSASFNSFEGSFHSSLRFGGMGLSKTSRDQPLAIYLYWSSREPIDREYEELSAMDFEQAKTDLLRKLGKDLCNDKNAAAFILSGAAVEFDYRFKWTGEHVPEVLRSDPVVVAVVDHCEVPDAP